MKIGIILLFLMGGASLGFANDNPYQSGASAKDYDNQRDQAPASCEKLKESDIDAYRFAQKLSPIHQKVFCTQFSKIQQQRAMALVDFSEQNVQGEVNSSITPDMSIEVVLQTARDSRDQFGSDTSPNQGQGQ